MRVALVFLSLSSLVACPTSETPEPDAPRASELVCDAVVDDACVPAGIVREGDPLRASVATGDALRVEDSAGDALFAIDAAGIPRWQGLAQGSIDGAAATATLCTQAENAAFAAAADNAVAADSALFAESANFANAATQADEAIHAATASFADEAGATEFASFAESAFLADNAVFATDAQRLLGREADRFVDVDSGQVIDGRKQFSGGAEFAGDVVVSSSLSLQDASVSGGSFTGGSFSSSTFSGDGAGLQNVRAELRHDEAPVNGCSFADGELRCDGVFCASDGEVPDCAALSGQCRAMCADSAGGTGFVDAARLVVPAEGVVRGAIHNTVLCANDGAVDGFVEVGFGVCQTEPCLGAISVVNERVPVRAGKTFSLGLTTAPQVFENGGPGTTGSFGGGGERRVVQVLTVPTPNTTCFLMQAISPGFTPRVTVSITPFERMQTW